MSDKGTSEPMWNPDRHLEQVYRRGRKLRNRRRLGTVAGGTLAALVLVAGVAAAVGGSGGSGRGQKVATAGAGQSIGSTTPTAPSGGAVTGSTDSADTSTTGGGTVATAGGASTTAPRHQTTSSTTATTKAQSTTTTSAGTGGDCAAGDLSYSTASNKSSYAVGEEVDLSLVVKNVSGHTCNGPSTAGIGARGTISGNGLGAPVSTMAPAISCTATCQPPVLAPGQSSSYGAGYWGAARPAGTYSAVASRLGVTGSATSFTVH